MCNQTALEINRHALYGETEDEGGEIKSVAPHLCLFPFT